MGLDEVGDLVMNMILVKLGPEDSASVACVSRRLRISASEESLWSNFCARDLNISTPVDHHGNALPSFRVAYQTWREEFGMYPWSLVKRVKKCWDRIEGWLKLNFPEAAATLRKGASEADLQEVENALKVRLPPPTRVIYRFHDGQDIYGDVGSASTRDLTLGLIGGYFFYDHFVSVCLLPLSQAFDETEALKRHLSYFRESRFVIVAAASTFEKLFFLNCRDGQLYVNTRKLPMAGEMMPCVPNRLITSMQESNGDQQQDALLLWLEEHGRRLQEGIIKLRESDRGKGISLFPERPPLCSTAVTNGVKVRASAVFVPEFSDLQDNSEKFFYAYSIRMSLQPEGCMINGMSFNSCQLERRHWLIRANGSVTSDVHGEAVIGKYPLLHPGKEEFVYESCTPLSSSRGSVEGSFTFVPGRLADPRGGRFEVQVAQFPLRVPDYIF